MLKEMKNYKIETILFPTDYSETANKALAHAIEITKKNNAKLILVHVEEMISFIMPRVVLPMNNINVQMAEASEAGLKKLSMKIKAEHGINIEYKGYSGNVHENIIRAAHVFNADLIVMGTHGTSGIKEWFFGSNAFSVVNNATVPVLTINHKSGTNGFKKIIFPFNENLLTLKKIEQVISLAKIFNATILLFGYTNSRMSSALILLRKKGEELAEKFAKENILSTLTITMGEDYAQEILKYAHESNADLISVVTNRNGDADAEFKISDKKLVNHSEIPILSVPVEE